MISPLIRWEHSEDWYVTSYKMQVLHIIFDTIMVSTDSKAHSHVHLIQYLYSL